MTLQNIVKLTKIVFSIVIILSLGVLIGFYSSGKGSVIFGDKILGIIAPSATPSPTVLIPTPTITPVPYMISFEAVPDEVSEGGMATFTWVVGGASAIISKTTVYFGTESTLGDLDLYTAPMETKYTEAVKDFISGDYKIPLQFIGNVSVTKKGKYYARAYALVDGHNLWSEERIFKVVPKPMNSIKIIHYPEKAKLGENTSFTWEVFGPSGTANYTAIVGSKESKSGKLETDIDLVKTPYSVLVKDFTSQPQNIPLVFIGNTVMPEYGKYYFRALAVINGKNIWSDEYSLVVE